MEYFDRDGDQITKQKWECLRYDHAYTTLAYERIAIVDGWIWIEALWDGQAEQYGPNGPMVFCTKIRQHRRMDNGPGNTEQQVYQYGTAREALKHFRHLVDAHTDPGEVGRSLPRFDQVADEL